MRRAVSIPLIVMLALLSGAASERRSWNKVRFVGGPSNVKPEQFDWNTIVTIVEQPALLSIDVAPATVFAEGLSLRLKPEAIVSISAGAAAWRSVAATPSCVVKAKPPALFGVLQKARYVGIVFESSPGKRSAVLLESRMAPEILEGLKQLTGKPIEEAP
jgi:hypothetical protein